MAKIVITKEELEQDQVLETGEKVFLWFQKNGKYLIAGLLAALAIYLVLGLRESSRQKNLMAANDMLVQAEQRFDRARLDMDWASPERIAAMTEVAEIADQVIAEYPDTSVARQALFLKGNAWYNAGDSLAEAAEGGPVNTQRAITVFTEYVAESEDGSFEQAGGNLALGYALENAYFLDPTTPQLLNDAMAAYRAASNNPNAGFLGAEAKLAQARLHNLAGEREEAIALYEDVLASRHDPLEAPEETWSQIRRSLHLIDQQASVFSLANTARQELIRMGEQEIADKYPMVQEAEEAEASS